MSKQNIGRLGLLLAVIAAVIVLVIMKRDGARAANEPGETVVTDVAAESDDSMAVQASAEERLPKLVELGATTCIPCQQMQPILDSLRRDFSDQLEVEFIHVYEEKEKAAPYRIRLMPTQVFLDERGDELFRHEGFFPRDEILAKWISLGYEFVPATGEGAASEMTANAALDPAFRIEVLYLHPTLRCEACLAAEKHAEAALHEVFQEDLDSGFIRWAALNYEDGSGGAKYAKRYGVEEGSALILSEFIDNKQGRWQQLDLALEVALDRDTSIGYLTAALNEFLQQCELHDDDAETGP